MKKLTPSIGAPNRHSDRSRPAAAGRDSTRLLRAQSVGTEHAADLPTALRTHARTLRVTQFPIAECAATAPHYPPRVRSLAAFGRRPPVDVARLSMAGIRNPAQNLSATLLPQRRLSPCVDGSGL